MLGVSPMQRDCNPMRGFCRKQTTGRMDQLLSLPHSIGFIASSAPWDISPHPRQSLFKIRSTHPVARLNIQDPNIPPNQLSCQITLMEARWRHQSYIYNCINCLNLYSTLRFKDTRKSSRLQVFPSSAQDFLGDKLERRTKVTCGQKQAV